MDWLQGEKAEAKEKGIAEEIRKRDAQNLLKVSKQNVLFVLCQKLSEQKLLAWTDRADASLAPMPKLARQGLLNQLAC